MASLSAWIQASRPLAQVNIAVPLALGQALAFASCGRFDVGLAIACHLFGLVDHLFIVFANDVADEDADRQNADFTRFSGGSRVLVEGRLSRRALAVAAGLTALVLVGLSLAIAVRYDRPAMVPVAAIALMLLWGYSFPPLRLSYRGHGEWLQAAGVGVVLPLVGYYLQCGSLLAFPWPALVPTTLLGWASNVTTGVPDRRADERAGKCTFAVRLGDRAARKRSMLVIAIAILATPWVIGPVSRPTLALVEAPALALLALNLRNLDATTSPGLRWPRFVLWNGAASNVVLIGWIALLVELALHH